MGPGYVIIKGNMVRFCTQGADFLAPAAVLTVLLTQRGAGDSFAGGLAGFLASQPRLDFKTMKTAMVYGSSAASFCVTDFGTKSIVHTTLSQIKERANQLKN